MRASKLNFIKQEYINYIKNQNFPCVAAKTALIQDQLKILVVNDMDKTSQDKEIIKFLYDFVDYYRNSKSMFLSATVIFANSKIESEKNFEHLMWQKLQNLSDLDAKEYQYDSRVDSNANSSKFSFSLKEEAFFVVGLNPKSSRSARQFKYCALVFNPHQQFEILRQKNCFEKIKKAVRKRDIKISGNVNPMLNDYGNSSEVYQYSGMQYKEDWKCPLKIHHKNSL